MLFRTLRAAPSSRWRPCCQVPWRREYSTPADAAVIRTTNLAASGSGSIRIVELNRPAARNALSRALLSSLRAEIDAVHAQYDRDTGDEVLGTKQGPTRALVIASAIDTAFCAGADLKERRAFTQAETSAFLADLRATFSALADLPIPTISAISSVALGGGLELALATHLRVLTCNAVVGLPETRLGIIPGAGGTYRLAELVGRARARDMMLTGRRVSAREAYLLGLADRVVDVDVAPEHDAQADEWAALDEPGRNARVLATARRLALAEAVRLALDICEGAPVAVRAALCAVARPGEETEGRMYERVVRTEDRHEALRAFADKRKPVFIGR